VVRLRASFPDGVLLMPRASDIRYDGLLPIDSLCFTDQTGDTAASIADAMPTRKYLFPWTAFIRTDLRN
jgi:hypothetical protein